MSLVPNPLIAAEIGHWISRRKQAKRKPPVSWQERDSEHSINEQDSVPICGGCRVCAPQAPHDPYDPSKKQEHNHNQDSHSN